MVPAAFIYLYIHTMHSLALPATASSLPGPASCRCCCCTTTAAALPLRRAHSPLPSAGIVTIIVVGRQPQRGVEPLQYLEGDRNHVLRARARLRWMEYKRIKLG